MLFPTQICQFWDTGPTRDKDTILSPAGRPTGPIQTEALEPVHPRCLRLPPSPVRRGRLRTARLLRGDGGPGGAGDGVPRAGWTEETAAGCRRGTRAAGVSSHNSVCVCVGGGGGAVRRRERGSVELALCG